METDPLPPPVTPWYLDKAFYALLMFIVGMIANVIASKWGYRLNTEEIVGFAMVVVSFIAGHKWKSGMLQREMIASAAVKPAGKK